MEIQFGPNSLDEPNLLYKLQRKIKVFNTNHSLPNRGYNLVACSSKYGVVFIASPDKTLSVYYLNHLINKECEPKHLSVKLEEVPTHIAVNSDQELLAVTGGKVLSIYPISQFQSQVSPSSAKLDINPSVFVSALQWNPCIADTLAIAYFDGTLLVSQVSSMQIKKVQSKARCICWSPKGKQLVVGNSDGTLCQYKPDLSPMKSIPAPNLFEGSPIEALAVYWISTYQFAVVYKNALDNSRPAVTIINTPKGGQPSCLNYEDICYSMGSNRPWYYYLQGLPQWNIILSSSSNSMEIATLASKDGASWLQWCQTDEARPELPLTDKKQENYPIGICIDTCAIHQLPWGENETLPYMPLLLVLSQTGLLTIFNIINLNKEAAQICVPPQLLTLPSAAMTSDLPDDVPPPQSEETSSVTFTLPQPKPQPAIQIIQQTPQVGQATSTLSTNQFSLPTSISAKPFSVQQPQTGQGFAPPPYTPQVVEQKPQVEYQVDIKSTPAAQFQISQVQAKPPPPAPAPAAIEIPKPQAPQISAALKAEQEKAYKMKVKMELKHMLIKEVNDFQMELYKFRMHAWKTQNQLQRDLHAINPNTNLLSLDAEKLKKDCSLEELREAIIQLKLELVRACAVIAEARTHHEAKDLEQWTQADPLTMKRMASVKKLAYYVEMQLDQAHKSLDYKWNAISNKDPEFNKPGQFMIRPILDDVYQLLVKQQEILSRQQAVLRTLRNTHNECDTAPVFKSSSLLRSTPFRNKDPLSKLTKNILNMSIEPQNKTKEQLLTPQKLDALRDVLSNHKPIKIKPVNVELRQQIAAMRLNYEKRMKEKASSAFYSQEKLQQQQLLQIQQQQQLQLQQQQLHLQQQVQLQQQQENSQHLQKLVSCALVPVKVEPTLQPSAQYSMPFVPTISVVKVEPKTETTKQQSIIVPKFTPVSMVKPAIPGLAHVARTLFTEEPEQATKPPQVQQPQIQQPLKVQQPQIQQLPTSKVGFTFSASITASANTRNVLKDLLQNKSQANIVGKNDTNTFMGQKICSPISFTAPAATTIPSTTVSTANDFTSKPIADINNMFNKFQPQSFVPESKPTDLGNQKSDETGEVETTAQLGKAFGTKKEDKPLTNLFGMKTSTPLSANSQNVPDVLKSSSQTVVFKNIENKATKSLDKEFEKSKENVLEKQNDNVSHTVQKGVNNDKKPISAQNENKALRSSNTQPVVTSASSPAPSNDAEKSIEATNETKNEASKTMEKPDLMVANASITVKVSTSDSKSAPLTSEPTSMFGEAVIAQSTATPIATTAEQPMFVKTTSTSSASSIFGAAVASQTALSLSTTTKTTPSGSLFNTIPTSTPSSVFGSTSPGSIFGNAATTQSSVSATGAQSLFSSTVSTKPSVFSSPTPASPSSVFGTAATTSAQAAFGLSTSAPASSTTTPSSVFGSSSPGSIFGTPASTPASVFGSSSTSVFTAGATTTQSTIFGITATTSQSLFGAPTATTQASIFGGATPTTQVSLFGAPATSQASVFGSTPSSQASVFGSTPTTQASVFGSPPATQASIFSSPTYPTQTSVFGSPTPATQASVFGAPSTQASIFGSPTPSTQASVFGTPTQTTQASVFGSPTTQASVFGSPTVTTAQSGSLFGGAESNLFASASISTTSAPSQTSGGNIFGGGGGGNVFGGKVTFGQPNPTVDNIFGGDASFGQKQTTNFWGNANTASGGGFGSGFGQQATTQPSSIFGGGGGSFSSPSSAPAFGSPQQNATFGGGDAKPSVFGSPQQQNAPTFGGSAFGSKPAFGQSASFGSSATFGSFGGFNKSPSAGFGSPATFGGGVSFGSTAFGNTSPGKVFGGSTPGFGAPTQSNPTFENLATQNTLTFGNLAQHSGQQTQQPPSFNTSPSFSGWRG